MPTLHCRYGLSSACIVGFQPFFGSIFELHNSEQGTMFCSWPAIEQNFGWLLRLLHSWSREDSPTAVPSFLTAPAPDDKQSIWKRRGDTSLIADSWYRYMVDNKVVDTSLGRGHACIHSQQLSDIAMPQYPIFFWSSPDSKTMYLKTRVKSYPGYWTRDMRFMH